MITPKEFNERKKLLQKTREEKLQNLIAAPLEKAFQDLSENLEKGFAEVFVTISYDSSKDISMQEVNSAFSSGFNDILAHYDWQISSMECIASPSLLNEDFIYRIKVEEEVPF